MAATHTSSPLPAGVVTSSNARPKFETCKSRRHRVNWLGPSSCWSFRVYLSGPAAVRAVNYCCSALLNYPPPLESIGSKHEPSRPHLHAPVLVHQQAAGAEAHGRHGRPQAMYIQHALLARRGVGACELKLKWQAQLGHGQVPFELSQRKTSALHRYRRSIHLGSVKCHHQAPLPPQRRCQRSIAAGLTQQLS